MGLLTACGREPGSSNGNWQGFVTGFIETYFQANPLFAAYQGRHEYDGMFPDWSEAFALVNGHKAVGSPVEAARRQLDTLEAFLGTKNLVSIPGSERALVHEAPPYQRFNFAYIDIPGPYEKGLPSIYYISPPDPAWPEAEQRDYLPGAADLLFTSVHEVWPGHFLNFLHSNRAPFTFGRVFVGYAFAEGGPTTLKK